jgi:hypothetical protein
MGVTMRSTVFGVAECFCLAYSSTLKMEAICSSKHWAVSILQGVTTQKTVLFRLMCSHAWEVQYKPPIERLLKSWPHDSVSTHRTDRLSRELISTHHCSKQNTHPHLTTRCIVAESAILWTFKDFNVKNNMFICDILTWQCNIFSKNVYT